MARQFSIDSSSKRKEVVIGSFRELTENGLLSVQKGSDLLIMVRTSSDSSRDNPPPLTPPGWVSCRSREISNSLATMAVTRDAGINVEKMDVGVVHAANNQIGLELRKDHGRKEVRISEGTQEVFIRAENINLVLPPIKWWPGQRTTTVSAFPRDALGSRFVNTVLFKR